MLTPRQRQLLKQLTLSGEMWDALMQVFEDKAVHALKVQDENLAGESPDVGRAIFLTSERLTCTEMAQLIYDEARKQERKQEPNQENSE